MDSYSIEISIRVLRLRRRLDWKPYVRKKMVAVHFTKIPSEPYTAHIIRRRFFFYNFYPCVNNIVYARFEGFITSLNMSSYSFRAKRCGSIYRSPSFCMRRIVSRLVAALVNSLFYIINVPWSIFL